MDECPYRYIKFLLEEKKEMEEILIQKNIDKKKIIMIVATVVGVLLVVYLGLSVYFMDHFYFRSKIGNVDVSGRSAKAAEETVQKALNEYELVITERDGTTDSIIGRDIQLSMDWKQKPLAYIEGQNGFDWVIKLFIPDKHKMSGTIMMNEEKLFVEFSNLSCMDEKKQILPVDAKASDYDKKTGYQLVKSIPGTAVEYGVFYNKIKEKISSLDTKIDMVEDICYVQPKVTDDNEKLLAAIKQLNKCLKAKITYQVGNSTQVLDSTIFQPWLYVNENLDASVNDEALTFYVKCLASMYNTCYDAKKFMTSYGKEITITNSHYGWKVDNNLEKLAIVLDIMSGEEITRDLNYSMVASSHEGNDYGNSYVEINLTAQHLFVYMDGQLVLESDFVSGDLKNNWGSPTGIWGLTYKTKNATLRGDNYATPVDFWMPFAGNVGMHDATWRKAFGGSIYKRDGSHGCINLPWSKAKQIYEYVQQGFPVLVYTLEGTQSELGIAQDAAFDWDESVKTIGTVSAGSATDISNMRTQYDALSDLAKQYVKNYQILLDAEAAYATIVGE